MKTILITGGAGFIGSAVVRQFINETSHKVVNVDKLTYAGNLQSLVSVSDNPRYTFEQVDSLGDTGFFTEDTAYEPNSPYSASKASSDHLVRAWHHTYGLPHHQIFSFYRRTDTGFTVN